MLDTYSLDTRRALFIEFSHLMNTTRSDVCSVHSGPGHSFIKLKHLRGNKGPTISRLQQSTFKWELTWTCVLFLGLLIIQRLSFGHFTGCLTMPLMRAHWFWKSKSQSTCISKKLAHKKLTTTFVWRLNISAYMFNTFFKCTSVPV